MIAHARGCFLDRRIHSSILEIPTDLRDERHFFFIPIMLAHAWASVRARPRKHMCMRIVVYARAYTPRGDWR